MLIAFIGAALAGLVAVPRNANAACSVTIIGTVTCNADTTTTNTTNTDGGNQISSDREQLFDNGVALDGSVQSGVTVGGFGLQLTQRSATAQSITMQNQGLVTTANAVNALQLDGNGGTVAYSGDGSVTNTNATGAAISVDNTNGNVSITAGTGAISGPIGINASTTGAGALTITTGAGLVSGTAGQAISASTENGALNVTVGNGGVTSNGANPAIDLTTTNENITVTANGNVSATGFPSSGNPNTELVVHGIEAVSNGLGNITVTGSGTIFGQWGRGIYALQSATGLGGITITGTGDTIAGTPTLGCCSAIRARDLEPPRLKQYRYQSLWKHDCQLFQIDFASSHV